MTQIPGLPFPVRPNSNPFGGLPRVSESKLKVLMVFSSATAVALTRIRATANATDLLMSAPCRLGMVHQAWEARVPAAYSEECQRGLLRSLRGLLRQDRAGGGARRSSGRGARRRRG